MGATMTSESQLVPYAIDFTGLGTGKLILGKPDKLYFCTQPDADCVLDRLILKVPCAKFMLIDACLMANVMVIGYDEKRDVCEAVDAFGYVGEGKELDTFLHRDGKTGKLRLCRSNRITIKLEYTGLVPEGMQAGDEYPFSGRFVGRAVCTGINGYP